MRSYIVRMRVTEIRDYVVNAANEAEARSLAESWEAGEGTTIETPDWEVTSVKINK